MSDRYTLHQGDCREVMCGMPDSSVDAVITDPPYELGFMGKRWDNSGIAFDLEVWRQALRVAKPGVYLLAFGGTRTFHRLACAIEDAGWELRDTILRGHMPQPEDCPWLMAWGYGSGFPKSHNGAWGGTALKPAWEPIIMARKPLIGTVEANWREHATGALNIDSCRVAYAGTNDAAAAAAAAEIRGRQTSRNTEGWGMQSQQLNRDEYLSGSAGLGRWPANLITDGSDEVLAVFPQANGQHGAVTGDEPSSKTANAFGEFASRAPSQPRGDAGSAARFFYCAKASKADRNESLVGFAPETTDDGRITPIDNPYLRGKTARANTHPTVKPTELMRYLCRLVTPPGGVVLDPFMGSGSTGKAAMLEGLRFIGIDLDRDADGQPLGYIDIARARIEHALRMGHQPALLEAA